MRYLGLDLGSKTLGVSLSDFTNTIASNYDIIRFKNEDYVSLVDNISDIIKDNDIGYIVLGLPKNMNNTIGTRANISYMFKDLLEEKYNIPVILEDERLTSRISNDILIKADITRKKRKKVVDKMAATIILQSYLDRINKKGKRKMEKKNTFTVINDEGREITCEVLFTFESDETNKNYIVYTDNTTDENGNIKVYASIFDPEAETSDLIPIETEREWKIIETILEEIQKESKKNESEKEGE